MIFSYLLVLELFISQCFFASSQYFIEIIKEVFDLIVYFCYGFYGELSIKKDELNIFFFKFIKYLIISLIFVSLGIALTYGLDCAYSKIKEDKLTEAKSCIKDDDVRFAIKRYLEYFDALEK